MKQLYRKYSIVGLATLIPLCFISYGSYEMFTDYYRSVGYRYKSLPENLEWTDHRILELAFGSAFFFILFITLIISFISSFLYINIGFSQNEKRLRIAHNMRIYCWIIVILSMLLILAIALSEII